MMRRQLVLESPEWQCDRLSSNPTHSTWAQEALCPWQRNREKSKFNRSRDFPAQNVVQLSTDRGHWGPLVGPAPLLSCPHYTDGWICLREMKGRCTPIHVRTVGSLRCHEAHNIYHIFQAIRLWGGLTTITDPHPLAQYFTWCSANPSFWCFL